MIDLLKRCKDSLWVRTHIDARIPDVSAAHLIDPAWLDHHRAAQRPAVPRNHYIHTTRRISCDLSESVGRDSTCIIVLDEWGVLEVVLSNGAGLPEAAATIQRLAARWNVPHHMITYDKMGMGVFESYPKSRRLRVTTIAPISLAIAAIRRSLRFTFNLALTSRKIAMDHSASRSLELSRVSRSARNVSTAANQASNNGFSDNGRTGIGGLGERTG
jgi:hypothetical protein